MLTLERMEFDSSEWNEEIQKYPDRTIFQTKEWLSFVADTQNAEPVIAAVKEGKQIVGYFVGLIVRKLGLRILGSPFPGWTSNYMGFCLLPSVPRRLAIDALMPFAFQDLRCVHLEIAERNLTVAELNDLGFSYSMQTSFEIDLTQSEDQLFASMSTSCRWSIRKAERNGVVVEDSSDLNFAEEYYDQLRDVFAKQSLVPTYGIDRVSKLVHHLYPTGMLLLLRARDSDGRCIATGIFPAMNRTMYFWGGASWRMYQHLRPNEVIQWHAMKYWKRRGMRQCDMGGGGEYKRKYGGSEIAFPWFKISKHSSILRMRNLAQQLIKTRQVILGKWKNAVRGVG